MRPGAPRLASAAAGRWGGLGAGLAAVELEAAAAFFEVRDGSLPGGIGDLDAVVHGDGAGGLRETCGDAFVLNDIGAPFERCDAALYVHLEFVGVDLRL